jgi:hypothetical protein
MYGRTHEARAEILAKDYPGVTLRTLEGYSRVCMGCSEKVWNFLVEGKAALTTVEEMCDWHMADQNKIVDECIAKGLKITVRQIRSYKKSGSLGGAVVGAAETGVTPEVTEAPSRIPEAPVVVPLAKESEETLDDRSGADILPGESKVSPEQILELRRLFREMPSEWSHEARAAALMDKFPGVSKHTLESHCRMSLQCTEKVWNLYLEGKAKLGMMREICSWEPGDQDFIIDECIAKNFGPKIIRKIRRNRNEHGWGYPECIAKATGEVPANEPRRESGHRKGLDGLLTDIADKGARWRAMVTQAIELVGKEEAEAGIHESIFTKVFLLRELIGNQYDFVNSRVQRYMSMIRKRMQAGTAAAPEVTDEGKKGDASIEEPVESVDLEPIPEGEKRSFQDRAAQHEGGSEDQGSI